MICGRRPGWRESPLAQLLPTLSRDRCEPF